ncbi:hypothetical protein PYW07_008780 [Mythimna separata]|uniref:Peptidase M14 domain-containing protein n=1 Tax=Mythimna separata TaxID=271217 RepID=A0AAD7YEE2_MYTSE|nr:hypothetical protein PYW07_008780 [Mythimna separata]
MKTVELLVLCVAVVSLVRAGRHDAYSSYSVHAVLPRHSSDLQLLQQLELQLDLDVWQYGAAGREALLMVAPQYKQQLLSVLDAHGIQHYVHTENVAKAIEKNEEEISAYRRTRKNRLVFQDYPRYAQIDAYMERLAAEYPGLVTVVNAGKSFEGRDIKYLKISTTNFEDKSKPVYFMDAMIHAREWVTTPVTLYSAFRLVENLRTEDTDLLNDIDWIIMPLVNPDGYEFSHEDTRLWRKTRSVNLDVHATCFGVDGNRNFDVNFNTSGVSPDPCNLTYPGTHPFSEPETAIVRDILEEYKDRIEIYMDIHSHGNWILFGNGDRSLPPNAAQLHHLGSAMGAVMDAMKLPQAGFYRVGNSATILYGSSGSAQDYGQLFVPFSYTLELPGYGVGFLVPPEYVDHINEETWQGIAVTARLARSYYRVRYNAATTTVAPATTTAAPATTTAAPDTTTAALDTTTAAPDTTTAAPDTTTAAPDTTTAAPDTTTAAPDTTTAAPDTTTAAPDTTTAAPDTTTAAPDTTTAAPDTTTAAPDTTTAAPDTTTAAPDTTTAAPDTTTAAPDTTTVAPDTTTAAPDTTTAAPDTTTAAPDTTTAAPDTTTAAPDTTTAAPDTTTAAPDTTTAAPDTTTAAPDTTTAAPVTTAPVLNPDPQTM